MTVAVLPLANDALKIDTPEILRVRLVRALKSRGYVTQRLGETNERLRTLGVTLGGQVAATHWKELQRELGVDAVLTGRVLKANTLVTGVVNTRSVEAELALTSLHDGRIVWYRRDEIKVAEGNAVGAAAHAGEAAPAVCLIAVLFGIAEGAAEADLRTECEQLAFRIVQSAPPPYRTVVASAPGGGATAVPLSWAPERARAIAPKGADGVDAAAGPPADLSKKGPKPTTTPSPAPEASATPSPR